MTRILLASILTCVLTGSMALPYAMAETTALEEKKVRVFFRKGKKEQDGPVPAHAMKLTPFDAQTRRNLQLLNDKINDALSKVEREEYTLALRQLEIEVLRRTDGCATKGEPDGDDLITDCRAQEEVYPLVLESILMIKAIK